MLQFFSQSSQLQILQNFIDFSAFFDSRIRAYEFSAQQSITIRERTHIFSLEAAESPAPAQFKFFREIVKIYSGLILKLALKYL